MNTENECIKKANRDAYFSALFAFTSVVALGVGIALCSNPSTAINGGTLGSTLIFSSGASAAISSKMIFNSLVALKAATPEEARNFLEVRGQISAPKPTTPKTS
jgi:hypothetical protein